MVGFKRLWQACAAVPDSTLVVPVDLCPSGAQGHFPARPCHLMLQSELLQSSPCQQSSQAEPPDTAAHPQKLAQYRTSEES